MCCCVAECKPDLKAAGFNGTIGDEECVKWNSQMAILLDGGQVLSYKEGSRSNPTWNDNYCRNMRETKHINANNADHDPKGPYCLSLVTNSSINVKCNGGTNAQVSREYCMKKKTCSRKILPICGTCTRYIII